MSDLDAAIRAKLASWGDDPCGYATCVVVGWSEMRDAVEAALDLHGKCVSKRWNPGCDTHGPGASVSQWEAMKACDTCRGREYLACRHCDDIRWEDDDVWPCPTVCAIAKALGVDGPDARS